MKSLSLSWFLGFFLFGTMQPTQAQVRHDAWDALLQKHVDDRGGVDYKGFLADEARLDAYLKTLSENPVQPSWPKAQQLAYWINAYNAFTVKLILNHYPVASIRDIHNGNPWDVSWIKLGGAKYSLNQIEHRIIRPQFKDARIHFAVNCAARSCPPLLNKAYNPLVLENQLQNQTRNFINHSSYNSLDEEPAKVSKIFEWYAEDFGDLKTFLNRYAKASIPAEAEIRFRNYDWALNTQ